MFILKFVIIGILFVGVFLSIVQVVPQGTERVVETLGKYTGTWSAGLHVKIPVIQNVVNKVSLKEQVADFPPQMVITKDNVSISADSVIYFKITNAKMNTYGVENYIAAIENLCATTLRSVIGGMTLDESLNNREDINSKMLIVLDEATDPWGIKITRAEVKNITPPTQMREAMESQARAEREKRASILKAEGDKQSAILTAEGHKESMILEAEAEKEKRVKEAEGEAEALERVQRANANALAYLKEAHCDDAVLTLKKLEAMQAIANGTATKLIIPSDLTAIAGMVGSATEVHQATKLGDIRPE